MSPAPHASVPADADTPHLFRPLTLRGSTLRNRIIVAPMCQYSVDPATPGRVGTWHLVHYGALARGGAGMVIAEATAVAPEGRITRFDAGLWSDEHIDAWRPVTAAIAGFGAVSAVQLAHAGRKAAARRPWDDRGDGARALPADAWQPVAPSTRTFPGLHTPRALSTAEVAAIPAQFAAAARRALAAGFDAVELHAAHGYLLHEFLSPLTNDRTDDYGGSLTNRSRLLRETAAAVRAVWPADRALLTRVSATDWVDGGFTVEECIEVARDLAHLGVDLVDVSSGALTADAPVPVAPHYQVPLAAAIRRGAGVPTAAVGLIRSAAAAESVLAGGAADAVALGRPLLDNPHWPLHAADALGFRGPWPAPLAGGRGHGRSAASPAEPPAAAHTW